MSHSERCKVRESVSPPSRHISRAFKIPLATEPATTPIGERSFSNALIPCMSIVDSEVVSHGTTLPPFSDSFLSEHIQPAGNQRTSDGKGKFDWAN